MTPLPEVDNFAQIATFAMALGVGLALSLLYDVFRLFRLLWPPSKLLLFFEDVLYWVISAVVVFCFLLVRCDGSIRFFAMLGLLLGWLTCHLTISQWIYRIFKRLVRVLHKIARWARKHIFRPMARLIHGILHTLARLLEKLCNILKKVLVFVKKCLQRCKRVVYNQYDLKDSPARVTSTDLSSPARDKNIRGVQGSHESRRKKKEKRKPVR